MCCYDIIYSLCGYKRKPDVKKDVKTVMKDIKELTEDEIQDIINKFNTKLNRKNVVDLFTLNVALCMIASYIVKLMRNAIINTVGC
jgi:hypothetical protein